MPEPRAVWMVGPAGPDPMEGILSLGSDGLSFAPLHGKGLRVPAGRIRRVRRLLASPALKVRYLEEDRTAEAFFFFSKPPPLPEGPKVLSTRNLQRTNQAMVLREQSKRLKGEIGGWVEEIRTLEGAEG
jgi:hypothetical protein